MRKPIPALAAVLALTLSGCLAEPAPKANPDITETTAPAVIQNTAEPPKASEENGFPLLQGRLHEWDAEQIKALLLPDLADNDARLEACSEDGSHKYYYLDDGRMLSMNAGCLDYNADRNDLRSFGPDLLDCYDSVYEANLRTEFDEEEFQDFTAAEAQAITDELLNVLEVADRFSKPWVIPCRSEIEEWALEGTEAFEAYTPERIAAETGSEGYVIFYPSEYNGTSFPIWMTKLRSVGMYGKYPYAMFVVTPQRVEFFRMEYVMDFSETGGEVQLLTPEEAAPRLTQEEYLPPELVYVGSFDEENGAAEFLPAWRFAERGAESHSFGRGLIYINAATGNCIN